MTGAARRIQRQLTVDANLRGSDNADYYRFASRTARAFGRRVADSDPDDLALLLALRDQLDDAITVAVEGQRQRHSWADIASALGMTRQAAFKRWGKVA
jgi:hypothetical protein